MSFPFSKKPNLSAFFRAIDRADELGSGMRKLMLWGKKYGGQDPQLIEGDNFRMILAVPEFGQNPAKSTKVIAAVNGAQSGAESGAESSTQSPTQSEAESSTQSPTQSPTQSGAESLLHLLCALKSGEKSSAELRAILKLSHRPTFRSNYLHPAMELHLIEYTVPDKPNSRLQKYRLTEKGRRLIMKDEL